MAGDSADGEGAIVRGRWMRKAGVGKTRCSTRKTIGLSSRKMGTGSHSPIEHGSTMGRVLTHFNKKRKQHGQYLLSKSQKEHLLSI